MSGRSTGGAALGELGAALVDTVDALEELAGGTGYADAVHRLLAVVRAQVGMRVAWLSEFVDDVQVLRFVDAAPGAHAPAEGLALPMSGSYCARVLDGRFPTLIPDARRVPEAALLDVTAELSIGAYVGVPLLSAQGVAVGMLCAVDAEPVPAVTDRNVRALRLLAQVLRDLQTRALTVARADDERREVRAALLRVVGGEGRHPVLQPIVDVRTGQAVAAEGLTRFTAASPVAHDGPRSPAQWFDDASRYGLRAELEIATAASVLDLLPEVPAQVALSVNLSPDTLMGPHLPTLLEGLPLERVLLEVTEHAPVVDYDAFEAVLAPYRAAGLRLAVDDAGAGYSSLRHVLAVQPEVVKVDIALVRCADEDLARRTLLQALVSFADATGCRLVAEGVETPGELAAVAACGVHLVQGYGIARPSPEPPWVGYPLA